MIANIPVASVKALILLRVFSSSDLGAKGRSGCTGGSGVGGSVGAKGNFQPILSKKREQRKSMPKRRQ